MSFPKQKKFFRFLGWGRVGLEYVSRPVFHRYKEYTHEASGYQTFRSHRVSTEMISDIISKNLKLKSAIHV